MSDANKRNIEFFASTSMQGLYEEMKRWQNEHEKRFLSMSIQQEGDKFSCICLTNPSEVRIVGRNNKDVAVSHDGCLWVKVAQE